MFKQCQKEKRDGEYYFILSGGYGLPTPIKEHGQNLSGKNVSGQNVSALNVSMTKYIGDKRIGLLSVSGQNVLADNVLARNGSIDKSKADYYPKGKVYRRGRLVIAQKQFHLKALSSEGDFGTKSCMIGLVPYCSDVRPPTLCSATAA
jgi:hypothetical protein